jgi:thiamine biosynthesis lipoprotein ApbE
MAKEKPMTVADMRENVAALTQIVQLMVKQQGQIIKYLESTDSSLKQLNKNLEEMLKPVEFSEEDMKLLSKAVEV